MVQVDLRSRSKLTRGQPASRRARRVDREDSLEEFKLIHALVCLVPGMSFLPGLAHLPRLVWCLLSRAGENVLFPEGHRSNAFTTEHLKSRKDSLFDRRGSHLKNTHYLLILIANPACKCISAHTCVEPAYAGFSVGHCFWGRMTYVSNANPSPVPQSKPNMTKA